ncbi:phytanoyl-CoA dioxygenase [Alteromonas sediminis]|uniref:Phytanoyl-CoA dioxygenase n=1 Tax=Alteromonas sediminis TaxID=2259342 RepID=A0A3N5Y201_9ALTE|nr:phytanoyl-CoA dioxygenase family protein [Alteromonas sediminis]RPJ66636.1 phytanoyl-CoA dioxygenase [Alteromonas sediminis]
MNGQLKHDSLTAEQVESFNQNGFLIIDIGLDDATIDSAISDMEIAIEEERDGRALWPGIRIQDGWKHSDAIKNIALNASAFDALAQLFARTPLAFQTLNFPVGTQQKAHSDTIHFNSMPSGFMAGVWVALEDVSLDNGALVYYPGSHKWPEYNMQDVGMGIGYDNYKHYESFIEARIAESNISPFYAELKKGQALIWHANLVHGGSKPRMANKTRFSQVTHYYFKGCKYYTPMNSTPDNIAWRQPTWIDEKETLSDKLVRMAKQQAKKLVKRF